MKRFITALLTLTLTLSTYAPVSAANTVNVTIDGQAQNYQVPPQIINGRTMLPLRAVGESLGMTVNYDQSTQTATLTKADTTVIHKIGTSTIEVNGLSSSFDTPSTIIDNRTLVPLRMLAEAIGADVQWVAATNTAVITTAAVTKTEPEQPAPTPAPAPVADKKEYKPKNPSAEAYMVGDVLYDPSVLEQYNVFRVTTPEQAGLFWESLLRKSTITANITKEQWPSEYIGTAGTVYRMSDASFDINLVPLPDDWTWDLTVTLLTRFNTKELTNYSKDIGTGTSQIKGEHFTGTNVTGKWPAEIAKLTPENVKTEYKESEHSAFWTWVEIGDIREITLYGIIDEGGRGTVLEAKYDILTGKAEAYYYENRIGRDATKTYLDKSVTDALFRGITVKEADAAYYQSR